MTLQSLIAILEEEKSHLLHLMDSAVREEDFKLASYNLKSIRHVDRQLHTLRSLEDALFEEKKDILETIERMKTFVESDKADSYREFYIQQIDSYYKALQSLDETPPANGTDSPQLVLDDYFNLLLENKIKVFKLVLSKSENLILEIRGTKGSVRVKLLDVKHLINNNMLSSKCVNKLMKLGFKWSPKQEHLFLNLMGNKNEMEEQFRTLVMLIVFEVFNFRDFTGQAYIEA